MSLYSALKFEIPVIAYSAFHQVRKGIEPDVYIRTMKDFHKLLRDETVSINGAWDSYRQDLIARALQPLRGLLQQYLTTPLRSDNDEVQRILRDRFEELANGLQAGKKLGMLATNEGRVVDPPVKPAAGSGKRYLEELGFSFSKPRREIFESVFVVEGGANLDVIEHLVRDRIGIYTPVHGKHIGEFDSYAYAVHNLLFVHGTLEAQTDHEAAVFLSKGGVKYDLFRNTLRELTDGAHRADPGIHVSVWQRKLGLGAGREFILRFRGNSLASLVSAFEGLRKAADAPFIKQPLRDGYLVCKEFVRL